MSRLLLQANAVLANSTASPSPSPPTTSGGAPKSGVIYTFTFIGATVLVGLLFLGLMFRYIVKYRYFRPPATELLQASEMLTTGMLQLQWLPPGVCCVIAQALFQLFSICKLFTTFPLLHMMIPILLQPAGKPEDEYVSNLPNIKEIVVISNPDG